MTAEMIVELNGIAKGHAKALDTLYEDGVRYGVNRGLVAGALMAAFTVVTFVSGILVSKISTKNNGKNQEKKEGP
jgi:hypothetical protein